jgi:hypothetical protein
MIGVMSQKFVDQVSPIHCGADLSRQAAFSPLSARHPHPKGQLKPAAA